MSETLEIATFGLEEELRLAAALESGVPTLAARAATSAARASARALGWNEMQTDVAVAAALLLAGAWPGGAAPEKIALYLSPFSEAFDLLVGPAGWGQRAAYLNAAGFNPEWWGPLADVADPAFASAHGLDSLPPSTEGALDMLAAALAEEAWEGWLDKRQLPYDADLPSGEVTLDRAHRYAEARSRGADHALAAEAADISLGADGLPLVEFYYGDGVAEILARPGAVTPQRLRDLAVCCPRVVEVGGPWAPLYPPNWMKACAVKSALACLGLSYAPEAMDEQAWKVASVVAASVVRGIAAAGIEPAPPAAPTPAIWRESVVEELDDEGNVVGEGLVLPAAAPAPREPPVLRPARALADLGPNEALANIMEVLGAACGGEPVRSAEGALLTSCDVSRALSWSAQEGIGALARLVPPCLRAGRALPGVAELALALAALCLIRSSRGEGGELGSGHPMRARASARFPLLFHASNVGSGSSVGIPFWELRLLQRGAALGPPLLAFASRETLAEAAEEDAARLVGELVELSTAVRGFELPATANSQKLKALKRFFSDR